MLNATNTTGSILLAMLLTVSAGVSAATDDTAPQSNAGGIASSSGSGSGSWQPCADIPWAVQEVYGTARDGKVIIAGGMVISDEGAPVAIDRTGIYDPLANAWTEGPALPATRHHPLLVSAGGRIYAFGGATHADHGSHANKGGHADNEGHGNQGGHWQARQDVYVLDREGEWSSLTQMPVSQTEAMVVEHEGRIHVIGGRTPDAENASQWSEYRDVDWHYVYDIDNDSWSQAASLPSPRNSAAVAIIDGLIYVAGGRTMDGGNIANLDRYDPVTDQWESLSAMPYAGGGLNGGVVGGQFYVFGGEELGVPGKDGVLPHAVRYDPAADQWQTLPDMPTPRHGHAVVSIAGTLFTIGGGAHTATGMTTATLEAFTPEGIDTPLSCGEH